MRKSLEVCEESFAVKFCTWARYLREDETAVRDMKAGLSHHVGRPCGVQIFRNESTAWTAERQSILALPRRVIYYGSHWLLS